jgi:UDP-N-acetylmuramoyl-tripeptide--D-alanyl-D-alanine ligase
MDIQSIYQIYLQSSGVTIDSRKTQEGKLFFALKGDKHDANQFAATALENGAISAVIDNQDYSVAGKTILVSNVLKSLQDLARYHRRQFNIPVIAITGSNGKTTTKELVYAVLSRKFNTLATEGNLNNHIGVPLTLLRLRQEHEMAIIEMGANHRGEIEELCGIAEPTHGIITSIGKAHIGEFGGLEAVKEAKAELYQWIKASEGVIWLNTDLPILNEMAHKKSVSNIITYGSSADVRYQFTFLGAEPFVHFKYGDKEVISQLPGAYNYNNLITAFAVGLTFGIPESVIAEALSAYTSDNNRSQIIQWKGHTVIKDAYNANPTSMEAALDNFAKMHNPSKVAILGDMLELGEYSPAEHQAIADKVASMEIANICLVGNEFGAVQVRNGIAKVPDAAAARKWLDGLQLNGSLILLKGSRGIGLEKVLA